MTEQRGPPSTPSQSPTGAASRPVGASQRASQEPQQSVVKDFFEDELRGYRVLKGAGLTNSEKQNILVQTNNTTSYMSVRRHCVRCLQMMMIAGDGSNASGGTKMFLVIGAAMSGMMELKIQGPMHGGMKMMA